MPVIAKVAARKPVGSSIILMLIVAGLSLSPAVLAQQQYDAKLYSGLRWRLIGSVSWRASQRRFRSAGTAQYILFRFSRRRCVEDYKLGPHVGAGV
jgi:hypothetical protein